jgi:dTDP-4-amino-4,6-dideoxygalactose transaminase
MKARRVVQIAQPVLGEEELEELKGPLATGWLTQGPKVAAFEAAFARQTGVRKALATSSATTGLHLALCALGIEPGDEVLVPAFTWVATANVVVYCGANPIFVDVDRSTYNIELQSIAEKITERTKAIIPVHLFGLCVDMDQLRSFLPSCIAVIEDAACAVGATYFDRPAGGLGDIGVFSFHPRKSITTGEGGMLTTNDTALAQRAEQLRNHGASVSEEIRHHGAQPYLLPAFDVLGFNYRMSDLQGAVGLAQLRKLDRFLAERQAWADYYVRELADIPWLRLPSVPQGWRHAWQAFVCYVDPTLAPIPRDEIMSQLHALGIATRPGTHAVHMLGYYRNRYGIAADDFPAARDCERNTMAIPLHNRMSAEDYAYVVQALHELR